MGAENAPQEYESLKNEIMLDLQVMDNSRNILYIAIGAILAFSLNFKEPFMALIYHI